MENISKILIIAAVVLIIILLIAFAIRALNSTGDISDRTGIVKDAIISGTEMASDKVKESLLDINKGNANYKPEIVRLDIADGCIEISSKGYRQGKMIATNNWYKIEGKFIEHDTGKYQITGNSNENVIRITEKGTYNITIKNLNINAKNTPVVGGVCAFNANRNGHSTGVYVNLNIEGINYLHGSAAGLGFAKGTPNVNGNTKGSTLTIGGRGSLYVESGSYCAAIGSGYTGFECAPGAANNIIINSGNITVKPGSNGCGIGGGWRKSVNNIIINGGTINAVASNRAGIGSAGASLDNLIINGGNITTTGGEYGSAIGGDSGSGTIIFNGGNVKVSKYRFVADSLIGQGCKVIEINGGTIDGYSEKAIGIGSTDNSTEKIIIRGGNLKIDAVAGRFSIEPIYEEKQK